MHYDQVTLTGTYHHAPRYLARALEILAEHGLAVARAVRARDRASTQLPDALAGRACTSPPPAKYTVLPGAARR